MLTRVGELTFEVPQVRSGDFYPSALEKGTRTEVHLALGDGRSRRLHPPGHRHNCYTAPGLV
jgi:hypothetical protein